MREDAFGALRATFDRFERLLEANTVPSPPNGRRIIGIPHAVSLSEAAAALQIALVAAGNRLMADHGTPSRLPPGLRIMGSDSPDGPWEEIPPDGVHVTFASLGKHGIDATFAAALQSATEVVAFPIDKWNHMQAARPGGEHQRWHPGEIITCDELELLASARRLLDAHLITATPHDARREANTAPVQAAVQFIPNPFQQLILEKLDGRALRTDGLCTKTSERRQLFRKKGGIHELKRVGLVAHHERVGFYRPDAPPPHLAKALGLHQDVTKVTPTMPPKCH
jgi:hypothetical protein